VEVLKQFVDNPKAHRASKADILNKLGHHYEVGKGVEQDYNTALDYHMQAGVAGSVASMLRVAELYESGAGGIKQDAEEGQRWRNTAELAKKEKEAVVTPSSLAQRRSKRLMRLCKAMVIKYPLKTLSSVLDAQLYAQWV
jgi:hypothetical protein